MLDYRTRAIESVCFSNGGMLLWEKKGEANDDNSYRGRERGGDYVPT